MRVLLTDGNTRAALAITRALGREGAYMIVGSEKHPSLASSSRYCAERFVYPDPQRDYAGFTTTVLQAVEFLRPDVVLPVTDVATFMVTEHKQTLEKYCTVPFPEYEAAWRIADKLTVMKTAQHLGIPSPKTVTLCSTEALESALDLSHLLGFPVVIKPCRSRIRTEKGWRGTSVKYAQDTQELKRIVSVSLENGEGPLLLQKWIYGVGVGVFLCLNRGEVVAVFSHRRLREKPPSGGVSVLRESIPVDPTLRGYAEKLLRAFDWHGVAMVEFKQDERAGGYKLMEVNGRFWGSLQLAIDAGVNFPSLLLRVAKGEKITPIEGYKLGVKSRWFWGDMDVLLMRLRRSNTGLCPPGRSRSERLHAVLEFLKFRERDLYYEVLDPKDIKPWLFESYCWFRGIR